MAVHEIKPDGSILIDTASRHGKKLILGEPIWLKPPTTSTGEKISQNQDKPTPPSPSK